MWTLKTSPDMNVTEQIVHCRCPKGAVTYLIRRDPLPTGVGYAYLFACSPQSVSGRVNIKLNINNFNVWCFSLPTTTAFAMPTQRTVQAVYGAQTPGVPGRGQHQSVVPVSAQPSLSQPSHGRRCAGRQELHRGQHPDVFRVLHAGRT